MHDRIGVPHLNTLTTVTMVTQFTQSRLLLLILLENLFLNITDIQDILPGYTIKLYTKILRIQMPLMYHLRTVRTCIIRNELDLNPGVTNSKGCKLASYIYAEQWLQKVIDYIGLLFCLNEEMFRMAFV